MNSQNTQASASNLLVAKQLPYNLQQTAEYIVSVQLDNGAIPWFKSGKLDPWDHVEAAMGLSVAGYWDEAISAYEWMRSQQLGDGSWQSHYFAKDDEFSRIKQTHFCAYIATGVWHHYLISNDHSFLERMFPCIEKAMNRVVHFQSEHGEIAWAYDLDGNPLPDALLTGCCSILRSLDCAIRISHLMGITQNLWQLAATKLASAILQKPERFDRTWPSKQRFAMDWYYPVLTGALGGKEAQKHINRRWHEFVEPNLGCRCVTDEPWVTMAETSELIIALVACEQKTMANNLYNHIQQWRHSDDGGYWTGYVFRNDTIWPEEKTTWTAAAVLLAADALFSYTKGGQIFSTPILPPKTA